MGNLTTLLNKIRPAVDDTKTSGERKSSNTAFVEDVAKRNVELGVEAISARSPILKEMIASGAIGIVGGIYDVSTGMVEIGRAHV